MKRKPVKKQAKAWQPLMPAVADNPERWAGMRVPDAIYVNNLYSVYRRDLDDGVIHISFHRHSRAPIRDWRHFQAIKNEVAGPERLAIEVFPPESQLIDKANEYHLWVLPPGAEEWFPFVLRDAPDEATVGTQADMEAQHGKTRARQRDWQPGLPTGLGVHPVNTDVESDNWAQDDAAEQLAVKQMRLDGYTGP